MREILIAFGRALRSLGRRDILWHLLWPSLVAVLIWTVIAVASWSTVIAAIMGWIEAWSFAGDWLTSSEVAAATVLILVKLSVLLLLVPLVYLTAALLVAVVALPLMLERVARYDYADLEQRHGGSNWGSAWNGIVAGAVFLGGLLVTLPFWLIPGVGLVATVLLTAWLNQRAFGYDALMLHADRSELSRLPRLLRQPMLLLGGACALLAYVPFVNLVAPAFCGLAFVHFMLESLRRERAERGVTVLDALPGSPS